MTTNSDLHEVEITIQEAKNAVTTMEALIRLRKNNDFKQVIEEGYLKNEAVRLVWSRSEPGRQTEELQHEMNKMIDGVGYLRQYLNSIFRDGNHAQQALTDHEDTRAELLRETA